VEHVSESPYGALLRLDQPGPGTAAFGTIEFGDTVLATLSFYLYGDQAAENVARETPRWQAWIRNTSRCRVAMLKLMEPRWTA
jgi:hypothetical protein